MTVLKTLLTTIFVMAFATTANAITILYNFENNGNDTFSELQFDDVTSSGTLMTVNSFGGTINQGNRGLGVSGAPEGGRLGLGEALIFSVAGYNIQSVTATFFETGNQDEDVFFGTQAVTVLGGGGGASTQSFSETFAAPVSSFSVLGLEPNAAGNRGVRVASIEVTLLPVPVPASGGLLLLALIGLGLNNKLRKR